MEKNDAENPGHRHRGEIEIGGPEGSCTLNPPADNGALCELSYESEMVGNAGNAPVRHFRFCFLTPDYRQEIGSLPGIGSGGGSCTHGGKAYEAHLNLILPAVKLVESVGNAPTSTCLQGRCIACLPRPHWQVALVLPQAG